MTTSQIVWTVVIVVAVLLLIGLVVASMRKKSLADNRARAAQLRDRADTRAAGLPDAEARAEQAQADAERARFEAERADEQAATARAAADQERALQEDQIRAADRLDPDIDNTADDYAPRVVTPAGPASAPDDPAHREPVDTSPRDETTGADDAVLRDRLAGDPVDEHGDDTRGNHKA